jgi:hypothetical protein
MNAEEAIHVITANYPPENYVMLREALNFAISSMGQIATLKAICIKERDRQIGCEQETVEQLAQEYPEIFKEEK